MKKLFDKIDRFGRNLPTGRNIRLAVQLMDDLAQYPEAYYADAKTVLEETYLETVLRDEVWFDNTLKETIECVKAGETGIMTLEHMELIRRKWEARPNLIRVLKEINLSEMTMLEESKVKLEGYRSHVENVYALMELLILWEGLHWCTREVATSCHVFSSIKLDDNYLGSPERLIGDIILDLYRMEAYLSRESMMDNTYSDFTFRFDSSLFSGLKPIVTRITGCLASDLSDADAVEKMQKTLSEIIPQLNKQVRCLGTAGQSTLLVKGQYSDSSTPGAGGAGGGGGGGGGASLFSQPTPREGEAGEIDKKTKRSGPKSSK